MDFTGYSTIVFLDSMVALEGKPLPSLPWMEIDPEGPILVLIVPQVMREVDKRKRDGRLGRRAREFNRLVAPAAESGRPALISAGPPAVDLAFALCDRIDWDALDDLEPEEGDARVVAQILRARGLPLERKLLLSNDINPIAMAARHGLPIRKMPDCWLLDPEPGPADKELARLKARVGELEAKEPILQVGVKFDVETPVRVYRISPLSQEQRSELARRIVLEMPEAPQRRGLDLYATDGTLSTRIRKWHNETIPRHIAGLHSTLESIYGFVPFTLTLENTGYVQADNLILKLASQSGGLHRKFRFCRVFGPMAPRERSLSDCVLPPSRFMGISSPPPGRHEVHFSPKPIGRRELEIHCADFRHGRTWTIGAFARVDPHLDGPFAIDLEATASNQRGAVRSHFELPFSAESVTAADLVDLEYGTYVTPFPLQDRFEAALRSKDWNWLDLKDEDD